MLDRREISPTFLGAAILAAALLTGTVRADPAAADDAVEEARAEQFVRRRIPGLTPQERDERAGRAGELRIRGRTRLSGTVFATHVHVERDAQIDVDGDLVIYSTGGIVIDAPIGGSATRTKRLKAVKPGTGVDGADGADITMINVSRDIEINADVLGNPGTPGENVTIEGTYGRGGDGGRGGDVTILAKKKGATITVNARIACAHGGGGGNATVTGAKGDAGLPGQKVVAIGGNGGGCGAVSISATHVVVVAPGIVAWSYAGFGGLANATGGDGGDAAVCFGPRGGTGGSARAEGGDGGRGSDVRITGTTVSPDPGGGASSLISEGAGPGGGGGDATATPGAGGVGPVTCPPSSCPAVGRDGSDGASSGSALARGGDGGLGSRLIASALAAKTRAVAEQDAGNGGYGTANPVSGRPGAVGEDAARAGTGGRGGDVGKVTAIGGKGGACRVGLGASGEPSNGGSGGGVHVGSDFTPVVLSGHGGAGGNCCPNATNYLGGTGGVAGKVGLESAAPGKGGKAKSATLGVPGVDGQVFVTHSTLGSHGAVGVGCPVVVGDVTMSDATLDDPLHVNVNSPLKLEFTNRGAQVTLALEVCCDGRPIGHFNFVVGGGNPGLPFVATFLASLFIAEKHAGHHISVMINGKTVKEFIRAVI